MSALAARCAAMTGAAVLLAAFLLLTGVPFAVLLAIAPALLCVGLNLVVGHGTTVRHDPDSGEREPATWARPGRERAPRPIHPRP